MKLTSDQKQYIKEHPTESAYAMAKEFGCSEQSVYFYMHKYHGDSFLEAKKAEQAHKHKVIREFYPTHSAREVAAMLGITKAAVTNMARRLGVKHTEETMAVLKERNIAAIHRPEVLDKRIDSLRKTIKMESVRDTYGLPLKTKRKLKSIPSKTVCTRGYLCRQYNYFYDKEIGELYTLFYDDKTRRLPPDREQHYKDVYHLEFRQADE